MLLETFQPATDPLGAPWLSALVAALPVVAMLVTLGALRWKAHHAGPFSWLLAFVVAVTAFGMPLSRISAVSARVSMPEMAMMPRAFSQASKCRVAR